MLPTNKFKLLSNLLNGWFVVSIFLITLTLIQQLFGGDVRWEVAIINLFFLVMGYSMIQLFILFSDKTNSAISSILIITAVSFSSIILLNGLYYHYTGSYLEFSTRDSTEYDIAARELIQYNLYDSISYYFSNGRDPSDFGAVFTTSLAYRIHPSPLTYNFLNVLLGCITVYIVYKIALLLMKKEYALLCSITYGLSSFILYFYSTGMKETWFVFGVSAFFLSIIKFLFKKKVAYLLAALLAAGVIYLFRPAVLAMLVFSTMAAIFVKKTKTSTAITLLIIVAICLVVVLPKVLVYWQLISGRFDPAVIAEKQQLAPSTFNYLVSFLSAAIGPLPSFSPLMGREQQAFYAVGLTLRVFLSLFFWFAAIQAFSKKNTALMVLALFTIFEMLSLALILESFELRLTLPHMPAVFILGFYGVSLLEEGQFKEIKKYLNPSFILVSILLIFWNLR